MHRPYSARCPEGRRRTLGTSAASKTYLRAYGHLGTLDDVVERTRRCWTRSCRGSCWAVAPPSFPICLVCTERETSFVTRYERHKASHSNHPRPNQLLLLIRKPPRLHRRDQLRLPCPAVPCRQDHAHVLT